MTYRIKSYTRKKARDLGVTVRPSTRASKKIDVYKNDKLVVSIGAVGYGDYPTFIESHGRAYAMKRRAAYHARHRKNNAPAGYYAKQLLW